MASDFNVNNNTSMFNSMFGTNATGGSSVLGDYAAIKNGSYKKLLSSYYGNSNNAKQNTKLSEEEEKAIKTQKNALAGVKSAAADLGSAAEALNKADTANREDMLTKTKDFVKAYNSILDSTDDIEDTKVLQKTLGLIGDVKANAKLLSKAGITIGSDNKLSVDEEKFNAATNGTVDTLFHGMNSLTGKATNRVFDITNRANEAVNKLNGGAAYTVKGEYTKLNTASALYNELF